MTTAFSNSMRFNRLKANYPDLSDLDLIESGTKHCGG